MADRSLDADGINASVLPDSTPLPGTQFPASVSLAEGSREGIPAGNTAPGCTETIAKVNGGYNYVPHAC